jgi:hypothetical protein
VWELPTPGGPHDFPRLVHGIVSGDLSQGSSRVVRALFAIRWKIGELLGWDGPDAGLGSRVPTLQDRLPVDLYDAPSGPDFDALPFTSLYLIDDEFAAEIANRTMHGVMHLGWVPDGTGGYHGQMAVYVKPNGLFGTAYMAAIRPLRHLIVYPLIMRQIERTWQASTRLAPARRPDMTLPRRLSLRSAPQQGCELRHEAPHDESAQRSCAGERAKRPISRFGGYGAGYAVGRNVMVRNGLQADR